MKKVFVILAISALFAACNNEAETGKSAEDSAREADSIRDAQMRDSMNALPKDTASMNDTANKMGSDTATVK